MQTVPGDRAVCPAAQAAPADPLADVPTALPSHLAVSRNVSPPVSVIVATRDRPQLLRCALNGIRDQDYPGDIECIVVFDQDEPDLALVEEYSQVPNRVVRVVQNGRTPGLAGARNTGVLLASGDYLAFCDDDDEWSVPKLSTQVGKMVESGVMTSVTGILVQFEDRVTTRIPRQEWMNLEDLARGRSKEAHPSTVVVRRDAMLTSIGLVDEDVPGSYGEDFDWILRAVRAGDVAVIEEALVTVRWGRSSMFSRNWQVIIDSIDYLVEKHPVLRGDREGYARLLGRRAFALAALGRRREAVDQAMHSLRYSWRERRAYIAFMVALRLVSAEWLMTMAHRRGRGI